MMCDSGATSWRAVWAPLSSPAQGEAMPLAGLWRGPPGERQMLPPYSHLGELGVDPPGPLKSSETFTPTSSLAATS